MVSRELCDDIADDIGELFTDPNDFAQSVTHTPRQAAAITLYGVVNWLNPTNKSDDRHNRQQLQEGQVLVGLLDTSGASYTLDEEGTFTVGGIVYQIADAKTTPGGYLIRLTRNNRKTINSVRNS